MEESKIKTAEEITHEAFKYHLNNNHKLANKAFADGANWMQNELQSHITKLEAENFALAAYQCDKPYGDDYGNKRCTYQDRILELEEALKRITETNWQSNNGQYFGKGTVYLHAICKKIAEQALNKKP